MGNAANFKFGHNNNRVHPNKSPWNFFLRKGRGAYPGTAHFPGTPIISGTGKATDFKFGQYIHRVHPNKSPLKILEKRERHGVGVYRDCPCFWVGLPPIISGTGKATNFKFCTHVHRINRIFWWWRQTTVGVVEVCPVYSYINVPLWTTLFSIVRNNYHVI